MARTNNKKGTAESDAALAEALAARTEAPEDPEPPLNRESREPTIADRFVGIADLIVAVRTRTRLSEATLVKALEVSLQYHAWDVQRREQEAQRSFNPASLLGNNGDGNEGVLIGPADQTIEGQDTEQGDAPDNVVPLNPTPDTTEEV
jgi:hypothetical protein